MSDIEIKISKPWYTQFQKYFLLANKYIAAYRLWSQEQKDAPLINFENETLARFIFESNNIEREGLPFGQTKELVFSGLNEFFDQQVVRLEDDEGKIGFGELEKILTNYLPINFSIYPIHIKRKNYQDDLEEKLNDQIMYIALAKFGQNIKEATTVAQHFITTLYADKISFTTSNSRLEVAIYNIAHKLMKLSDPQMIKSGQELLRKFNPADKKPEFSPLLSEEVIKQLHFSMAKNLIASKYSQAGEYRHHSIMTDFESHFPAPEAVSDSMKFFIEKFCEFERNNINPITLASWASTQFVLIHPFSDFNGRMSRLIMNMVLRSHSVPFWVSLRSSKIERKRYFTALRHYQTGKQLSVATLIAIQIVNNIENFNKVLSLSGYPNVEIDKIGDPPPEYTDTRFNRTKSVLPTGNH